MFQDLKDWNMEEEILFLGTVFVDIYNGLDEKRMDSHGSTSDKGIEEYTTINSNHMYMRDMKDTMTCNPKQKIVFLNVFTRLKSRLIFLSHWFATQKWHNITKRGRVSVWISRVMYKRNCEIISHYLVIWYSSPLT